MAVDEEGKAIPTPGVWRWEQVRARQTIDRLKLIQHQPLAEARRKVWQRVNQAVNGYYKAKSEVASGHSALDRERLRKSASRISELTKCSAELSAVLGAAF